jgi:GTPase SAR1 family protein
VHPEGSYEAKEEAENANTRAIEKKLEEDMEAERKVIKCLLLGAGECGKSTILKQMKILHQNGWTLDEKKNFAPLVYRNTIESMHTICTGMENYKIPFGSDENRERAQRVLAHNIQKDPLPLLADLQALWKDSGVAKLVNQHASEINLLDSASYFFDNMERTFVADYIPTPSDILRTRLPTTGIIQTDFWIDKLRFKMFDVGGQRGERKKWIHCFDSVTAIFFIASLSEYDQFLQEDRTRNRLQESLALFEGLINLPWFRSSPVILFLNKNDVFIHKIAKTDLGIYFPQYTGGLDYDAGLGWIRDAYFERNNNPSKNIYCHVTEGTNTENISFVWKSTKHIIIEKAIQGILC